MKHFLSLAETPTTEIEAYLDKAIALKKERQEKGYNEPILHGKTLAMIFQKPSLRTRVSFETGMLHLGGHALYLSPEEIRIGKRESAADIARVLSGYVDGIMARTFDHQHILDLAEYATVPVINALSDYSHPCQVMGDFLTIIEHQGKLEGLKLAYVGDGNNVAVSLLMGSMKMGLHFTIATPPDYALSEEDIQRANALVEGNVANINITYNPQEAVKDADIVYTDTWVSMGHKDEYRKRLDTFPPYQVNDELVALAKPDCIVMHCLPAHRGQEITNSVADGKNSVIFQQTANRLHAQKGILALLIN
ncbi:MAG: ornithine carbamoyltransferase [Anaerolineaceae bacterium 4572_78]|nr:MAG: ornithine carbamoyltransferase [Anaerolineaceae bacterium 4572_78]